MKIYSNPKALFNNVLAIYPDHVMVARPTESALGEQLARLEADPAATPDGAKHIPFATITNVRYNEKDQHLDIHYRQGKDKKEATFTFADTAEREEVFAELKKVLPTYSEKRQEMNAMSAGVKPLLVALVLSFFTYIGFRAAQQLAAGAEAEVSGRHSGVKRLFAWLLDLLGPTGVLIIGGLMVAGALLVLVKRMGEPPIWVTLKKA